MSTSIKIKNICVLGVIPFLAIPFNTYAKPWLDAGDMRLRHQLELLSDAGLLDAPITTWPLSSRDIHQNLKQPEDLSKVTLAVKNALNQINERLIEEDYSSSFKVTASGQSKELLIRDFSAEGREKASVSYDGQWGSSVVDLRLKATIADKSDHPGDNTLRFDESYIATSLGNWKFTVGMQSRWWGPGWDGSLILSNNARPIPSLSLENVSSGPFKSNFMKKYFGWIGPNKLHMFIGKLESDRSIPNAKLIGTRFTFKPLKGLEVGLHRTIQWGGEGQDQSFSDLLKTIASVRITPQDRSLGSVKGNQIAGLDWRWKLPLSGENHYTFYGQYIGEDRVDGSLLLGDEVFLLGGSIAGYSTLLGGGSWRTYLEATDTSAGSFKGRARNNIVYNHGLYTDGYRHLGLSLGHGIDSDSRMVSAGAMFSQKNGNFWRTWLKHAKINEDGIGNNPLAPNGKTWSSLGLSLERKLNEKTSVNLGVQLISEKDNSDNRDNDFAVSIGFSRSF